MGSRGKQILLIATFIPTCWLAFQMIHELGHVLAAMMSGGVVTKVVLHPLEISRTDVAPNPNPLTVVWAGPVIGAVFPIFLWAGALLLKLPGVFLFRFFAGFCLIGNGAYIGCGSFAKIGDAGVMLAHGSSIYLLWIFGITCFVGGLIMWNGLGSYFGFGKQPKEIDNILPYSSLLVFISLFITLWMCSPT